MGINSERRKDFNMNIVVFLGGWDWKGDGEFKGLAVVLGEFCDIEVK